MKIDEIKTNIDRNLLEYVNGEKNILMSSEENPISMRRQFVKGKEYTDVYYGKVPRRVSYGRNIVNCKAFPKEEETTVNRGVVPRKARGTGGKEAYVMLMTKNAGNIKGLSVIAKAILLDMCLEGIAWNTGKLMQERGKKPHTAKTIAKLADVGLRTAKTALKELSEKDIIKYDKKRKFYFMCADYARKGAVIENEDKIREGDDTGKDG